MMMIRRHWKAILLQSALVVACILLVVGGLMFQRDQTASAQQVNDDSRQSVTVEVYQRTQALRKHLALTNPDLAAMGLSLEQAQMVISDLRQWTQNHAAQITAGHLAQASARRALRQAQRQVMVGPRDERVIEGMPGKMAALAQATKQQRALLDSAAVLVSSRLSGDQRVIWTTARHNRDAPARYRYTPDLDADQKAEIAEALRKRPSAGQRHRVTESGSRLGFVQKQALTHALANQRDYLRRIEQAEAEALPMPRELMMQELAISPDTIR